VIDIELSKLPDWLPKLCLWLIGPVLALQVAIAPHFHIPTAFVFLASIAMWLVLIAGVRNQVIATRSALVVGALTGLAMVILPPGSSLDFNSYAIYGQMTAEYGLGPYEAVPRDIAFDPWYQRISYFWADTPSVYGPVFAAVAHVIMSVAGESEVLARAGFAAVGLSAVALAIKLAATRIGVGLAVVMIGLNPLVMTFGLNDLHCDVWIGTLVLAGAIALDKGRFFVAAVVLCGAALIKVSILPALAGAAVWLAFRHSWVKAIQFATVSAVTLGAGFAAAGGLSVVEPILGATSRHTRFSIWNPVHEGFVGLGGSTPSSAATADALVSLLANAVVLVAALVVIWRMRHKRSPYLSVGVELVVYQLLGAYVLSWYAIWTLPLLAVAGGQSKKWFVVVMTHGSLLALAYLSGWLALVVLVVIAAVLATRQFRRQRPRQIRQPA